MWSAWEGAAGVLMAASGFRPATRPPAMDRPVGAFIHALAMTTKIPDAVPATATRIPAMRWALGLTRSQPYR